jgi:hypothetical protein
MSMPKCAIPNQSFPGALFLIILAGWQIVEFHLGERVVYVRQTGQGEEWRDLSDGIDWLLWSSM